MSCILESLSDGSLISMRCVSSMIPKRTKMLMGLLVYQLREEHLNLYIVM